MKVRKRRYTLVDHNHCGRKTRFTALNWHLFNISKVVVGIIVGILIGINL